MNIIVPLAITADMIKTGTTIAEPAAGETLWVTGGTHTAGEVRIRTTTHRQYTCVQSHTGRAALPEVDAAFWKNSAPTQRFAPFDIYTSTAAETTGSLTYVMQPGFFNALSFYGLLGASIAVTVKDAPGGAVIYSYTGELYAQAPGLYELLFAPLRQISRIVLRDIPVAAAAELTVTVDAGSGLPVKLGMLNIGDFRSLVVSAIWGGTEYGASADPKSYSFVKSNDDGTSDIRRRGSATDMRGSVLMPADQAESAVDLVQSVLDIPVSCIATTAAGYDYLNVFGLLSGSQRAEGPTQSRFEFSVRGFI